MMTTILHPPLLILVLTLLLLQTTIGFHTVPLVVASRRTTRTPSQQLECICINCKHVVNCNAYHFVEEKHEQPHIAKSPTFEPRDGSPSIDVTMRPITDEADAAEKQMKEEHKSQEESAIQDPITGELTGQKIYDLAPQMDLEYDVVACEDFIKDEGIWIRNMPEEIRLANPDFVPP